MNIVQQISSFSFVFVPACILWLFNYYNNKYYWAVLTLTSISALVFMITRFALL